MTHPRISTLIADCFGAFSTPEAATAGVTFPPDLCALWSEALRLASLDIRALEDAYARVVHERDQLLAVAEDADLIAHARAGAKHRYVRRPMVADGGAWAGAAIAVAADQSGFGQCVCR